MAEQKKIPARTSEELGSLERIFFAVGGCAGFINSFLFDAHGAPLETYFVTALPLLVISVPFAYNATFKDLRSSLKITALTCGGYLVGEAVQMIARNYF